MGKEARLHQCRGTHEIGQCGSERPHKWSARRSLSQSERLVTRAGLEPATPLNRKSVQSFPMLSKDVCFVSCTVYRILVVSRFPSAFQWFSYQVGLHLNV